MKTPKTNFRITVLFVVLVAFVLPLLASFAFATTAYAAGVMQEAEPTGGMQIVLELGKLLVALLALGLSTERGTQLLKTFWNLVVSKVAWLNLQDKRSFIFAAAIAFGVSYFFKVDITQYLSVLDGFDPELLKLVNALLLTFAANYAHDKLPAIGAK